MKQLFLSMLFLVFFFTGISQVTLYVNPDATSSSADGTKSNPYNDIAATVDLIEASGGGELIIVDGDYDLTGREVRISTQASPSTAVLIKPETDGGVRFTFKGRFGFEFETTSSHITLQGFELYGATDQLDYWDVVARGFWGNQEVERNGGLAVIIDGEDISIVNNYIHDWYQKAVEIRDARYALVEGNIIHDIAVTSLTGGHGIMRQQKGREFFDDDQQGKYRWDISENMIFNVEQTIYSWVPSKGLIEMVIDEGKSILIDDPKDSDGQQEHMSARIKNNVVAFGSVDHIRLKSTPNLEVSHNSIYSNKPNGDGITDKQGDTETPQFINFICHNNAAHTVSGISAIEIDKCVEQTVNNGGTPDVVGNYAMDGKVKPPGQTGITRLSDKALFVNPEEGNFRINPALGLPVSTGVDTVVLNQMKDKLDLFQVTIIPSILEVDHLRLTQTILDNIPGVNDGVNGNETVFEDQGIMASNYQKITFKVVNGDWKNETGSPNTQVFHLNENYSAWYESIAQNYLNAQGSEYDRIRWGNSEIKQNQSFNPNGLTVCQIRGENDHTQINGYNNEFILAGDLLIDFENFTPALGDSFDLIFAKTIEANNGNGIFDRVLFEGHVPSEYQLEIVSTGHGEVLRLTIGNTVSIKNKEAAASKILLSPNPFNDQLDIRSKSIESITVYSVTGSEMNIKSRATAEGYTILTQTWDSGIYFVKVNEELFKVVKE